MHWIFGESDWYTGVTEPSENYGCWIGGVDQVASACVTIKTHSHFIHIFMDHKFTPLKAWVSPHTSSHVSLPLCVKGCQMLIINEHLHSHLFWRRDFLFFFRKWSPNNRAPSLSPIHSLTSAAGLSSPLPIISSQPSLLLLLLLSRSEPMSFIGGRASVLWERVKTSVFKTKRTAER